MSIAEKLTTIAENEQKVYDAGKQAEYDRFWDSYQNKGKRIAYIYAFAGAAWTDTTYNPKYPINATGNANSTFAHTNITDTKVDFDMSGGSGNKSSTFLGASYLVTIRKLIVSEAISLASTFQNCTRLKNITIEGTIGRNTNFQWCDLTLDSLKSVIKALMNYAGTETEFSYKLTLNSASITLLDNESVTIDGTPWREYINSKCWNIA